MEIIEAEVVVDESASELSEANRAVTMPLPSLPSGIKATGDVTRPLNLETEPDVGLVEPRPDSTLSQQPRLMTHSMRRLLNSLMSTRPMMTNYHHWLRGGYRPLKKCSTQPLRRRVSRLH